MDETDALIVALDCMEAWAEYLDENDRSEEADRIDEAIPILAKMVST